MSNRQVTNPTQTVSRQDLADFYDEIFPYLGGKASAGFTPVGTIISVMGVTAPANYLACDGTVYNISDYPELAAYFGQQFSMVNKFGGDGTTTFAVPDLRGEFLRGTGTNSHSNQGSGSAVGIHQDATIIPQVIKQATTTTATNGILQINSPTDMSTGYSGTNFDSTIARGSYAQASATKGEAISTGVGAYTTRPTNTSVLYCIATKNIYMNPSLDYSTDEKVVGSFIDGKPIYQKTIVGTAFAGIVDGTEKGFEFATGLGSEVDTIWIEKIDDVFANKIFGTPIPTVWSDSGYARCATGGTASARKVYIYTNKSSLNGSTPYITIQYTKTTD